MKKSLFLMGFSLIFVMIFGIVNVKADETTRLFIFDDSLTKLDYPYAGGRQKAKDGDKIQLQPKLCTYDANLHNSVSKTDASCRDVEVTYSTNDSQAINVSDTGLITINKGTYGGATVTVETKEAIAEIEGSTPRKLSDTYKIYAIESEENVHTTVVDLTPTKKTTTTKKKNTTSTKFYKTVKTYYNPSTGIEDYLVYIVISALVVGTVVVLKNKRVSNEG